MTVEERLRLVQRLIEFWFSPWGAAKGARWEALTGDKAFSSLVVGCLCEAILAYDEEVTARVQSALGEEK